MATREVNLLMNTCGWNDYVYIHEIPTLQSSFLAGGIEVEIASVCFPWRRCTSICVYSGHCLYLRVASPNDRVMLIDTILN
jgi:hypothetical protein